MDSNYVGRFAPSPSGPLHFGSLIAALASYLDARVHRGRWLLRIDDIDKPRVIQGAAEQIIAALRLYGFEWDDIIIYQSQRIAFYEKAYMQLKELGHIYACACSRKEIADSTLTLDGSHRYPGTCRQKDLPLNQYAIRVNTKTAGRICFEDLIQNTVCEVLEIESGDFVIRRADSVFSYQLSTVVDDAMSGVTHVIRGADLLHSTPRQIFLQRVLKLSEPTYAHLPVVINAQGEKLSKQTRAPALNTYQPQAMLVSALQFLNQAPPIELMQAGLLEVWEWAIAHWDIKRIPQCVQLVESF